MFQHLVLMVSIACLAAACGESSSVPTPDAAIFDAGEPEVDADGHEPDASLTEPSCEAYCALMEVNCLEEALHPHESCMAWCGNPSIEVPLGTLEDTDVNTLGCRMHFAELADTATSEDDRATYCAYAHASGGNQCGTFCENYCDGSLSVCSSENEEFGGTPHFTGASGAEDCATTCAAFSTDVLDGISQTEQHFGYGDTVQCRLHHLEAAMIEGPSDNSAYELHCGHAGPVPTDLCTDNEPPNVTNYCQFALTHCTGDNSLFPKGTSRQDCTSMLTSLVDSGMYDEGPFLSFRDTTGNSLGCLNYWIMLTPVDPEANCAKGDWDPDHWMPSGSGVCVAP